MSYGSEENKLLLNYSDTLERATLVNPNQDNDEDEDSMPSRRRGRKGSKGGRRRKLVVLLKEGVFGLTRED